MIELLTHFSTLLTLLQEIAPKLASVAYTVAAIMAFVPAPPAGSGLLWLYNIGNVIAFNIRKAKNAAQQNKL